MEDCGLRGPWRRQVRVDLADRSLPDAEHEFILAAGKAKVTPRNSNHLRIASQEQVWEARQTSPWRDQAEYYYDPQLRPSIDDIDSNSSHEARRIVQRRIERNDLP